MRQPWLAFWLRVFKFIGAQKHYANENFGNL